MATPNELAISLIRAHADTSAKASMTLVRGLRAAYTRVPDDDLLKSVKGTLLAVADYIEKNDDKPLVAFVEAIIGERKQSGLEPLDFALMSHCYLPPLRQVFLQNAPTPADGNAAFDVVESIALPLMERLLRVAVVPREVSPFLTAMHVRDIVMKTIRP